MDFKIPTGFAAFDQALQGGLTRGRLILFAVDHNDPAAESLGLDIARITGLRHNHSVLFFNSSISARDTTTRIFAAESGVPHNKLSNIKGAVDKKHGNLNLEQFKNLKAVLQGYEQSRLRVNTDVKDLSEVERGISAHCANIDPLDLVIINPLATVAGVRELAQSTHSLKAMARNHNTVIIAIWHVPSTLIQNPGEISSDNKIIEAADEVYIWQARHRILRLFSVLPIKAPEYVMNTGTALHAECPTA
jgi:replicative DNA helicase